MADLAASAVTINAAWTEGGPSGKLVSCRDVTLVLTAQGTMTNKITAAVLRLNRIAQADSFRRDDHDLIIARPSYDGANLLLYDVKNATDANREDPVDVTDTIRGIVRGISS